MKLCRSLSIQNIYQHNLSIGSAQPLITNDASTGPYEHSWQIADNNAPAREKNADVSATDT
jgi:hypothetical protein